MYSITLTSRKCNTEAKLRIANTSEAVKGTYPIEQFKGKHINEDENTKPSVVSSFRIIRVFFAKTHQTMQPLVPHSVVRGHSVF